MAGPVTSRGSLIRPLLGFLDRKFEFFSPKVQDLIGVAIVLVLVIYVLNGFVAPTFVRGQLFVKESSTTGRQYAPGYTVRYKGEETSSNRWGNWMLPLYRSGIPGKIRIQIENPPGNLIDEYSFIGPWPVWNAISPLEYILEIHPFEPQGDRIKVSDRMFGDGFLQKIVRWLEWVPTVYAQVSSATVMSQGPYIPEVKRGVIPAESMAAYGMTIQAISIEKFPGWFRSSFRSSRRVYFTVTLDGEPIEYTKLLHDPRSTSESPALIWSQWGEGPSTYTIRQSFLNLGQFPVEAIKESWIPIRAGETEYFEGLTSNLISAVSLSVDPLTNVVTVQPKGQIQLNLWIDYGSLLGSFDLTEAVKTPNRTVTLNSTAAGEGVSIDVLMILAWGVQAGILQQTPPRMAIAVQGIRLDNIAKSNLDEISLQMQQNSRLKARIIGYTDDRGSEQINQRTGLRRAEAVKNYLVVEQGIDPSRFEVLSAGETQPIADNTSPEGRSQNRRAEIELFVP